MTHRQLLERIAWIRETFPDVYAETVRRMGGNPDLEDDSVLIESTRQKTQKTI